MKKAGILHAELSAVVAGLGHGDLLVIGDAGLPVPPGVPCVDLAVTLGVPGMLEVLDAVLSEMCVEAAFRAEEAGDRSGPSPANRPGDGLRSPGAEPGTIGGLIDARVACKLVPHEAFKARSAEAVAVVRTGEGTAYANVGLVSGVVF
ncbi:MAG: D-ribose pyranase [Pseudomonadota bacterium]